MQNRTHTCDELRLSDAGKRVQLSGWMDSVRIVSANLAFVILRDFYGTTQVVIDDEEQMKIIRSLNKDVAHCPCCAVCRRIQNAAGVRCSIRTQAVDFQRIAIIQPPRHWPAADSNAHQRTIVRYADRKLMPPRRFMVAVILLHKCVCRFQVDWC